MGTADHDGPAPDLYQLLGVPPDASREEIAAAWRRQARAAHPDARPADTDAPGRFRALTQAWQVLGDPVRRAAYDRALARGEPGPRVAPAGVRVPVRYLRTREEGRPPARAGEPPLWAGPVRVEAPWPASPSGTGPIEEEIALAFWAGLVARHWRGGWGRPW
jgi:curved DNA-binding protein CbpA